MAFCSFRSISIRESRLLLWCMNGRLSLVESGSGEEESRWGREGEREAEEEMGGRWWGREVEEGELEEEGTAGWSGEEGGGERGGTGGVLGRRLGLVHCSSRAGLS